MVKCPICKHLDMKIKKDKLVCSWCGHEQKQLKEDYVEPKFRNYKEILE